MGMDGVETLDALQWIAELLAVGLGVFFAICFLVGLIAGPDKIKPASIIPERIELGYISEPQEGVRPSVRSTPSSAVEVDDIKMEADKIKQLRNKVQRLKLEKQLRELEEPEPILDSSSKTLMSDCVSSLIALGEKPADAKKLVKSYLSSHPDTSSVDEFITGIYSS